MNLWTDIRDFLFPRLCLSCGKKLLQSEDGLCISCFSSLPYTHLGNTSGNEMEKCFWGRFVLLHFFIMQKEEMWLRFYMP